MVILLPPKGVINKILFNQNLYITNDKLKELLKVKDIEINLPVITPEDNKFLVEFTGKSKYKGFLMYMYLHIKI